MSNVKFQQRQVGLLHFPGLVHFVVVLVVTGIEILGLTGWLQLLNGTPLSTVLVLFYFPQIVQARTALGLDLFLGVCVGMCLLVERVIAQMDQSSSRVSGLPFSQVSVFSTV